MRVLVTGGGGFLGRHIVEGLLARGDKVRVLGRRGHSDLVERGVEIVQTDLGDAERVQFACSRVDAVFHAASLTGIGGRRALYYAANVVGTENVLAGCRKHGVKRLVYTSTPSVVFRDQPIEGGDETLPYPGKHLNWYAETKAIAEQLVIRANGEGGLMTCSLRPHLIFGPGDTNLIPRLIQRAKAGRLRKVGAGQNRISVSYVENIADAHLLACDRLGDGSPVCGQCYFLNEEEPVNCWEFLARLLDGLGCPPVRKSLSVRAAYRLGAVFEAIYTVFGIRSEPPMTRFLALQLGTSHWFRIAKAKRDLGWEPKVGMEEALQRLFDAFRKKKE